jgi:hypothetical protein
VRRWTAVGAAGALLLALLVALGPARLRPWECREIKSASTARGALDAYYEGCWDRPEPDAPAVDLGAGNGGNAGEGYGQWNHLISYSVRYGDGDIRFLLVGQKDAGGPWRAVQGEGTGP